MHLDVHFAWKVEKARGRIYTDSWAVAKWFGWMIRNLEGTQLKIGGKEIWGRGMWIDLTELAKNVKISVSHVNSHQRMTSAEEDLIIKWL